MAARLSKQINALSERLDTIEDRLSGPRRNVVPAEPERDYDGFAALMAPALEAFEQECIDGPCSIEEFERQYAGIFSQEQIRFAIDFGYALRMAHDLQNPAQEPEADPAPEITPLETPDLADTGTLEPETAIGMDGVPEWLRDEPSADSARAGASAADAGLPGASDTIDARRRLRLAHPEIPRDVKPSAGSLPIIGVNGPERDGNAGMTWREYNDMIREMRRAF